MSSAITEAAVKEALELSYAFRQNAALRNGLPDCKRIPFDGPVDERKQDPPTVNITNNIPAAEAVKESPSPGAVVAGAGSSLLRRAAPFLLTAIGAGALPFGLDLLFGKEPPAVVESADPKDGSLLQWLQDEGRHVPEGAEWQTK